MNFTREPIIETIITPKEGYKLLVRSSKGSTQEEYSIDALEVVSFGSAIFYRSQERPKPFLVPVVDYEVVEVKEARVVLKNANLERQIKIGGGREAPLKMPAKEVPEEEQMAQPMEQQQQGASLDKKRDRRRHRRRRGDRHDMRDQQEAAPQEAGEGGGAREETQVSSPSFTTLIPPPTTLISQTIARYKESQTIPEENVLPSPVEEQTPVAKKKEEEEDSQREISDLYRTSIQFNPDTFFRT